jgi:hypothetical protein
MKPNPPPKRLNLSAKGAGVLAIWLRDRSVIVWGDGTVHAGARSAQPVGGAIVDAVAHPDGRSVLVIGADSGVYRIGADLNAARVADLAPAWADRLVADAGSGVFAVATGRTVQVRSLSDGALRAELLPPKAPAALALRSGLPGGGSVLAVGHGGGVTLYDPGNVLGAPQTFEAPGGHGAVTVSPDGQFLLASSSEPALVGWRIWDGQAFRMGGYPAKPDGLVWLPDGRLATTGGPAVLVWPFDPVEGPMGQSASMTRPRMGLLTAAAPRRSKIAAGWSDGGVDVVDTATGIFRHVAGPPPPAELDFDPRKTRTRVTTLAFSPDGRALAWAREDGVGGVTPL